MINKFSLNFEINFENWVFWFLVKSKKETREDLEASFRGLEAEFHEKVDKKNWYIKGKRTRKLWTPVGDIDIERRIYINRHTNQYKILFDEAIKLDKYLYIQKSFYPMIMLLVNKVYSYEKLSKIFGFEISKWAIKKIMKEGNLYFKPKKLMEKAKIVYVNLDGIFINQWKAKQYEVKCALAYTGVENVGKSKVRNRLLNKVLIPFDKNMKVDAIYGALNQYLVNIYGNIEKIVFVGDGARWIDSALEYFPNGKRYIDQFHFLKYLKDLLPHYVKIDKDLIRNGETNKLKELIYKILADENGEINLSKTKRSLLAKIKRFHVSYQKCYHKKYINAIEAIQSHYIASTFKNRRAFSTKVAKRIMMINCAEYNGWEVTTNKAEGIALDDHCKEDPIEWNFNSSPHSNVPGYTYSSNGFMFFRKMINFSS